MQYLMRAAPRHCWMATGEEAIDLQMRAAEAYHHELEIPHILRVGQGTRSLIVPADHPLDIGDTIYDEYDNTFLVSEILERRKARGDWRGRNPDFVKVFVL